MYTPEKFVRVLINVFQTCLFICIIYLHACLKILDLDRIATHEIQHDFAKKCPPPVPREEVSLLLE